MPIPATALPFGSIGFLVTILWATASSIYPAICPAEHKSGKVSKSEIDSKDSTFVGGPPVAKYRPWLDEPVVVHHNDTAPAAPSNTMVGGTVILSLPPPAEPTFPLWAHWFLILMALRLWCPTGKRTANLDSSLSEANDVPEEEPSAQSPFAATSLSRMRQLYEAQDHLYTIVQVELSLLYRQLGISYDLRSSGTLEKMRQLWEAEGQLFSSIEAEIAALRQELQAVLSAKHVDQCQDIAFHSASSTTAREMPDQDLNGGEFLMAPGLDTDKKGLESSQLD